MYNNLPETVITVGAFDGVHLGHQEILKKLKNKAREIEAEPLVITFWPHPSHVIGNKPLKLINTLEEKKNLIKGQGIKYLEVLPFTQEFAKINSFNFIKEYLIDKFNMKYFLIGYNHHFGNDRQGDIHVIKEYGLKFGFEVEKAGPVEVFAEKISSTKIRHSISEGHIESANLFLGYEYYISGTIVRGQELGRTIGFPTANVKIDYEYKLLPKDGVYAVKVELNDNIFKGMLNIGFRPTVNKDRHHKTIEVHLIDFDGDIYDKFIKVNFIKRIRDEIKFDSIENLKAQLTKDRLMALEYLD